MSGEELALITEAFASNWIAPLGPHVDAFEKEVAEFARVGHAAALSSGTAAIHLALRLLGLQPGEEVLCPTFTFSASANPIVYDGGKPVFLDSEAASWNMDPGLLAEELAACAARGRLPRAVIAVDLYGQCADYDSILEICAQYEVPVIQDSAPCMSRPVWKPLHLQPVFAGCRVRGGDFAASVFERGLCLPSGSSLSTADLERVCALILAPAQRTKEVTA